MTEKGMGQRFERKSSLRFSEMIEKRQEGGEWLISNLFFIKILSVDPCGQKWPGIILTTSKRCPGRELLKLLNPRVQPQKGGAEI